MGFEAPFKVKKEEVKTKVVPKVEDEEDDGEYEEVDDGYESHDTYASCDEDVPFHNPDNEPTPQFLMLRNLRKARDHPSLKKQKLAIDILSTIKFSHNMGVGKPKSKRRNPVRECRKNKDADQKKAGTKWIVVPPNMAFYRPSSTKLTGSFTIYNWEEKSEQLESLNIQVDNYFDEVAARSKNA